MDVLYILGYGSAWGDRELRFSLRSLERYGKNIGRVFVVGENPGFLSSEVVFHQCSDPSDNREYNIAAKILFASMHTDISPNFLFVNDDHIFLEPFDTDSYPNYWYGTLEQHLPRTRHPAYAASIQATIDDLKKDEFPTLFYDIHTPITYNRGAFTNLIGVWERSRAKRNGFVVKSTYVNRTNGSPGPKLLDLKLVRPKDEDEVRSAIQGRPVFSFADSALVRGVSSFLYKEFPKRSRFEASDVD